MIKVMIVDDQELIRHSLKIILGVNSDMEVVAMAADGTETLQKLKELRPEKRPDVILMDIRMPVMDGVECTAQISKKYPDIKVIALTTFDDEEFVFGAFKSGASGYLLKGSSLEELSGAIRTVYTGGAMLNPNVASTVIRQFSTMAKNIVNPEITDQNTEEITKSEWCIIHAVARGMSNKEIAESLWLSQGTVRNSISSILNKLHLRDRTQLAIWAVQTGIVNKDLFDT
ncbi:MAG: response regulator transcription factor [Lachnospiraceae bacterium]|nr:response regulator transcription factor [Lachnospiraceae bacterium]